MSIAGAPIQRLFWAWFTAGVDTVRCASSVQGCLVRQMIEISPVSLASQFLIAFHDTYATTHDDDRALA